MVGLRLVKELRGESCQNLELTPPVKKNICTSRSYSTPLTALHDKEEATSTYASRCAAKLRAQHSCARSITAFIMTNKYGNDEKYVNSLTLPLPVPTNCTLELIQYATAALRSIYVKGYRFKKSGVMVNDLVPEGQTQLNLLDKIDRGKRAKLMEALDKLNGEYGREKVKVAIQGTDKVWHLRQERLSPCYTTKLSDVLCIAD